MHAILRDAVYALRKLSKNPGFTFLAVVTLALGIGLNSAVFSVVNAVLFRPLPVEAPGELVNVYTQEQSGSFTHAPMAFPDYLDLAEHSRSFQQLAAYTSSGLVLEHGEQSEWVLGPGVSAEQANAEIETLGARFRQEFAATNDKRFFTLLPTNQVRVWPGLDQALYTASLVVMGVVALVLLIACANLANMLLARAVARRKRDGHPPGSGRQPRCHRPL